MDIVILMIIWQKRTCNWSAAHSGLKRSALVRAAAKLLGSSSYPDLPRQVKRWGAAGWLHGMGVAIRRIIAAGSRKLGWPNPTTMLLAHVLGHVCHPACSSYPNRGKLRLPPADLESSWDGWNSGLAMALSGAKATLCRPRRQGAWNLGG